jgi:CRISPR/Cas system-associated exonuclease Cas4 (RecB family)
MIDVVQAINESKAKKIKLWPVNSNRASEMGHPCERYLVYLRTRSEDRILHDVGLQFIFDDGNLHEQGILSDLKEAGFKIIEQQRPFEWKKYQITGMIDAKILDDDKAIPIEIKSFNPYIWEKVNSIQDMLNGKTIFLRKYPAQLTLYLIMDEKEEGLFILKNKVNGRIKQIPISLDYNYAESLIQKAERINLHVTAGTLPDQIPWEAGACENCSFINICLPSHEHKGVLLDDPEIEIKLDRRWELKPMADEFNELDREIKDRLKEIPEAVIGNWVVKGKWIDKKEYTVQASRYWQMTLRHL